MVRPTAAAGRGARTLPRGKRCRGCPWGEVMCGRRGDTRTQLASAINRWTDSIEPVPAGICGRCWLGRGMGDRVAHVGARRCAPRGTAVAETPGSANRGPGRVRGRVRGSGTICSGGCWAAADSARLSLVVGPCTTHHPLKPRDAETPPGDRYAVARPNRRQRSQHFND